MSHYTQAWYNPDAQPVDAEEWISREENLFAPEARELAPTSEQPKPVAPQEAKNTVLPQEVMDKIKERMGFAQKAKEVKGISKNHSGKAFRPANTGVYSL
jgi:hypothetical protein